MGIEVPNLQRLGEGKLSCSVCEKEIAWDRSLEVGPCPACGAMLYYPMVIRNYVLYKPIGGGGVGHVFKSFRLDAHHEKFAVKLLLRSKNKDPNCISRIFEEAQSGMAVGNHRNLIPVVEYGHDSGEYYLVMPFVDGERLDNYIKRKKHLSEQRTLNILLQILEAEIHISSCGYLFRDLKPENIILEKNGNIKLFDYGLCIVKSAAVAKEFIQDNFEGSPLYIPPERIVGASEGEYSEIYSLGMILFHMLKGRPYFSETEINELITKHVSSFRILSVQGYLKSCSKPLVTIIDKMIARKPDMRYLDFISLKKDILEVARQSSKKPSIMLKSMKKGL